METRSIAGLPHTKVQWSSRYPDIQKTQAASRQLYMAIVFSLRLRCCIGAHCRSPFTGSVWTCWRGLVVTVDADDLYDAGSPKAFGLTTKVGLGVDSCVCLGCVRGGELRTTN